MAIYLLMFVYISFLAFFLLKYEDKEQELRFLVLPTFFFFLIIAGFRTSSVGGDLGTYISIFESNNIQLPDLSHLFSSRFEIGYLLFNIFLRNFSDQYSFLLFVFAFTTLFSWFFVISKNSKNAYISFIIYFSSLGMFFYSLSNIRQGLAIALSFLGIHYLLRNKKILATVFILLAPLFHISGIVCLLYFPFKKILLNKKIYKGIFLVFLIIFPFTKQLAMVFISLFPQYTSYLETSWFLESNKWAPILLTILYWLVFIIGEMVMKKKPLSKSEQYIKTLFFVYLLLTMMSLQTTLLERFAYYFAPIVTLYIPMVLYKIEEKKLRWILFYFILLAYFLNFLVLVYYKPEWYQIVPYRTIITDWLTGN